MEVDGLAAGLQDEADRIEAIAKKNQRPRGAQGQHRSRTHGAVEGPQAGVRHHRPAGLPSYCTQDGVVPRTKLPEIMRHIQATAKKYGLGICNVFHAGDGNIHPILLFDERDPDQVKHVLDASHEILEECISLGGSVTGEHGIGVEKIDFMPLMFTPDDLDFMVRLRTAFNPDSRCSPGKMLPTAGGCMEPSAIVTQTKPARRAAV